MRVTLGAEPEFAETRTTMRVLLPHMRTEFDLPMHHALIHVGNAVNGERKLVPALWFEVNPDAPWDRYEAEVLRTEVLIPAREEGELGAPYVHLGTTSNGVGEALHVYARELVRTPPAVKAILRDPNAQEFKTANNMAGTMSRADAVASISDEEREASERAAEELLREANDA